jgi:hypothetical protein
VDGIRDWNIKFPLLMGGQRTIDGALKVEDEKTATGSPTRSEFLKASSQ